MEQTQPTSRRTLFIGIAAVIGLIFLVAVIAYALSGGAGQQNAQNTAGNNSGQSSEQQATKQNLNDLDQTIKQAAKDQEGAKAALKDDDNQIKVSN